MHLKIRHLSVFHAVMEEGSISKAAERMGLTQPAVSTSLANLEEMLGYPLFTRSKGHLAPKPEAEQLHADAELALLSFERFTSRAQRIGEGAEGLVRLGTIGSTALHFCPDVVSEFLATRDKVEVALQVRSSAQIASLVGAGQMDIGLVEASETAPSIDATMVAIPCVAILRRDDPLAAEPALTPKHFADRRLISVGEDHTLDRRIRAAFGQAGVPWRSVVRCYFFSIMRRLVAKGAGVAIVDAVNGCAELQDDVVWRPFAPTITFDLAVISRADAQLRGPAKDFWEVTIDKLRSFQKVVGDAEAALPN